MSMSKSTRREFLKTTAAVAAGAAVPYWTTSAMAKPSAVDKLRLAAIGVGGRGTAIGTQAASLGNMVACCDVHAGNAKRFAAYVSKHGAACKVYNDYRELLATEKDVDAVVIGTPDHWHVKIAIDAMKAGKHVYCEKPLTLTIGQGDAVREAVKRYGRVFQVGTQQRSDYQGVFLKAVAIARSGRLGKNLRAISSVGRAASRSSDPKKPFGPFATANPPAGLDWNLWLGPAPDVAFCPERIGWNFRWWFEYSGGQVTDWGVHHTDIAFWALAGKDAQAVEAQGTGTFMAVDRQMVLDFLLGKVAAKDMPTAYNVAHAFDVDVKLSNGNTIKIISGKNELLIEGDQGKIRVNRGGSKGQLSGKPVEEIDADPKATKEIQDLMAEIYGGSLPAPRQGHMQNFFDCVASGKLPVANVNEHVRAVNACHMANLALLLNRKIRWDVEKRAFLDDAEANKLVHRPQRSPFAIDG
jgi:myo-inositol 2-dehydrogenase / D-chiro-inositol 1-dehydrogenase